MKQVIINSVYAARDSIVTLVYDENRNVICYSITRRDIPSYEFYQDLWIDVSEEQKEEILSHAEEVWGCTRGTYLMKCFSPISADLWQFIEDCWDVIRRKEPKLFPNQ